MPVGGRPRCGSTPSTPSSSTAGRRQSVWPFQSGRLLGGSPPGTASSSSREQWWSGEGHTSAATWPYRAERRDPFMTHAAENRGHEGFLRAFRGLFRTSLGGLTGPVDMRFYVERVTGIEPAWPAWKAGALPLSYTRETVGRNAPLAPTSPADQDPRVAVRVERSAWPIRRGGSDEPRRHAEAGRKWHG